MQKTITAMLISILFLGFTAPVAFGQSADWEKVIALKDKDVAVKTANGTTTFGKLTSADSNEITLQPVVNKKLSDQTIKFQKSDVKKVWTAKLKLGKGLSSGVTTAIGAGIGAGAGLGLGMVLLGATGGSDSGGSIVAAMAAIGAGAGGALGFFAGKGGNKKVDLVYEVK